MMWICQSSTGRCCSITTACMTSINQDHLLHLGKHTWESALYRAWGPGNTKVSHYNVTSRQAFITPKSHYFSPIEFRISWLSTITWKEEYLLQSISSWLFKIWILKKQVGGMGNKQWRLENPGSNKIKLVSLQFLMWSTHVQKEV